MNYRNLRIGLGLIAVMSCPVLPGSAQQASTGGRSTATATGSSVVPQLVNYSGVLTDINGKPLTNIVGVTFTLYQESGGGTPLWMEIQNVQPTKSGHYSVMLGSTTSAGLAQDVFANGEARWLGVQAEGQAEQPRVLLLSVPYALKAADAETLGGLPPSAFMLAASAATSSTWSSSASPAAASLIPALPPAGTVTGTGTVNYIPLWTSASNIGNSALFQTGSGTTANVGISTTTPAVKLDVNYGDGLFRGGHNFQKNGDVGHVYAGDTNHSMTATFGGGLSFDTWQWHNAIYITDVYGLVGIANGIASPQAQLQINAQWGFPAINALGWNAPVGADSYGTSTIMAIGGNAADATSYPGDGIYAYPGTGGTVVSGSGLAALFQGNVWVLGTLTPSASAFRIDHPLDPANKFLNHSSVQSPDMMNIYNGNVVTDSVGRAIVPLPEWFEALNRDFRYQLTVIGQFAQAIVEGKIANNQFVIRTDKPAVEVSWQVTGIRQDAWANAHRIPVEEQKSPRDQVHYMSPELYGAPEEASIGWAHNSKVLQKLKEDREKAVQPPSTANAAQ